MQAPKAVRRLLESGQVAVKHAAALLAVVTHAANNHSVPIQRPDGTWGSRTVRDAQQPVRHGRKRRRSPKPPAAPAPLPSSVAATERLLDRSRERPLKRPCLASAKSKACTKAVDAAHALRRAQEIGASAAVAVGQPSAQQRMQELTRRVKARVSKAALPV